MSIKDMPVVDWVRIESSAPAKFIVSGEYSVVYERHAIAAAIDLRTRVKIRPGETGKVRLNLKDLNSVREWPTSSMNMCKLVAKYSDCLDFDDTMPIKLSHLMHQRYLISTQEKEGLNIEDLQKKTDDATTAFLLLYIAIGDSFAFSSRPPIDVEVESDIPVGAGLGSSSAFAVALCGALMRVFRVSAEKYIISNWAFNIDKFFHGKPSGVDNSVITHGGFIFFQNGKIKATGPNHRANIKVMLIDTGVSRSTRELGQKVAAQLREDSTKINGIFNNINDLTLQTWRHIADINFIPRQVSAYLQANQDCLNELGVGHEKLTQICSIAQRFNLNAKQTGAGGGGIAFLLYDDSDKDVAQLRSEYEKAGFKVQDHVVSSDGLKVTNNINI